MKTLFAIIHEFARNVTKYGEIVIKRKAAHYRTPTMGRTRIHIVCSVNDTNESKKREEFVKKTVHHCHTRTHSVSHGIEFNSSLARRLRSHSHCNHHKRISLERSFRRHS